MKKGEEGRKKYKTRPINGERSISCRATRTSLSPSFFLSFSFLSFSLSKDPLLRWIIDGDRGRPTRDRKRFDIACVRACVRACIIFECGISSRQEAGLPVEEAKSTSFHLWRVSKDEEKNYDRLSNDEARSIAINEKIGREGWRRFIWGKEGEERSRSRGRKEAVDIFLSLFFGRKSERFLVVSFSFGFVFADVLRRGYLLHALGVKSMAC